MIQLYWGTLINRNLSEHILLIKRNGILTAEHAVMAGSKGLCLILKHPIMSLFIPTGILFRMMKRRFFNRSFK